MDRQRTSAAAWSERRRAQARGGGPIDRSIDVRRVVTNRRWTTLDPAWRWTSMRGKSSSSPVGLGTRRPFHERRRAQPHRRQRRETAASAQVANDDRAWMATRLRISGRSYRRICPVREWSACARRSGTPRGDDHSAVDDRAGSVSRRRPELMARLATGSATIGGSHVPDSTDANFTRSRIDAIA